MKVRSIIRIVLPFLILLSCVEEEDFERKYPHVSTNDVTEITPHGALFSAHIAFKNLDQITEIGFIWGKNEELDEASSFRSTVRQPASTEISASINAALVASKKYYVRAFAKAGGKTSYGNIVSFMSLGSDGPVVTSIEPDKGILGDTITILGKNFIGNSQRNTVKFGTDDITPYVLEAFDSAIVVTIPPWIGIDPNLISVSVTIEGNVSYAPTKFEILLDKVLPKIESITPMAIAGCDTVMFVGKNLYAKNNPVKIYVNHHVPQEAVVVSSSPDTVVFVIKDLPTDNMIFTLNTGRFETTSAAFAIDELRPEFVSVSPTVYKIGDIITIKAKHLPFCEIGIAEAASNGADLEIISKKEDEIKIKLPEYCMGDFQITLKKSLFDNYILLTPTITQKPPEVISINPDHGDVGDEVVISGTGFTGLDTWYSTFYEVMSFTDTEIRGVVRPPYEPTTGPIDVLVHACVKSTVLDNAFTYNPPKITDFNPKIITSRDQSVSISGKNFYSGTPYITVGDVVIYTGAFTTYTNNEITFPASQLIPEPATEVIFSAPIRLETYTGVATTSTNLSVNQNGPWKRLKDFPGSSRFYSVGFSIGDKGYNGMGNDSNNNFLHDLWEYNGSDDSWTRKADYPGTNNFNITANVINNKAYVGLNSFENPEDWYEFDPAANTWTRKADYPGTADFKFAFEIDGKVYTGGGSNGGSIFEFWVYDPTANSWERKADVPGYASDGSIAFGFNGKGYVYGLDMNSTHAKFTYDPISDQWSSSTMPPYTPGIGRPVVAKFEGYVIACVGGYYARANDVYKIVPGSGTFEQVPYAGPTRQSHSGFRLGNLGFIGLGHGGLIDFWRFDPAKF